MERPNDEKNHERIKHVLWPWTVLQMEHSEDAT